MSQEVEPIGETLIVKLPFFIIGVALGMLIFWVALQWVPSATMASLQGIL